MKAARGYKMQESRPGTLLKIFLRSLSASGGVKGEEISMLSHFFSGFQATFAGDCPFCHQGISRAQHAEIRDPKLI